METAYSVQCGHKTLEQVKELPWKVFRLNDTKLMVFTPKHVNNSNAKPQVDLFAKGARTIESLTSKTFNQQMKILRDGAEGYEAEVDELVTADFTFETPGEVVD